MNQTDIDNIWAYLSEDEKLLLAEHALAIDEIKSEWKPLPGPQTEAYHSESDQLFYGGSAGSGKTDLILGIAHKEHFRTIIYRREYNQLKGIIERGRELFDNRNKGRFNQQKNFWRLNDDRSIELGACQHLGDEQKHQGIPHDAICFDEITHFHEAQYRFLCGWLRSTRPNQRKRVICAGNPPTTSEGDWVIKYWGAWLDPHHPNPAIPGELRWYTTLNGQDIECPSGDMFEHAGEFIRPESRTFIPGTVDDNPYLLDTGYKARLQALPEPLRSKMLKGDFSAGREDDAWQVIPTDWVLLAQKRWRETPKPAVPMSSMGIDVARGGGDKTCITIRYNNWVEKQLVMPGASTPDGDTIAAQAFKYRTDDCIVIVDVIGVGASVFDAIRRQIQIPDLKKRIVGFQSAGAAPGADRTKQLAFINNRAYWYWRMREMLDPVHGDNLCLPDDRELLADLCAPRWELTARGVKVEPKEDIVKRIGRSPDKGDSIMYCFVQNMSFTPYSMPISIFNR